MEKPRTQIVQIQTSTSARVSEDNAILFHISNFQHSCSARREDRLLSRVVWIHTSPFVNLPRYLIFNPLFVYFSDNSRYQQQCWLFVAAAVLWSRRHNRNTNRGQPHPAPSHVTNKHHSEARIVTQSVTLLWRRDKVSGTSRNAAASEKKWARTYKKWEKSFLSEKVSPVFAEELLSFCGAMRGG